METRKTETHGRGKEFDDLSGKVIAAAIEVHKNLGPGFVEGVYEQALRLELTERGIRFEPQKEILVSYKGKVVGRHVLDLLVDGNLIVELKAVSAIERVHLVQVKSYLRALGTNAGLLLNFGDVVVDPKRVVLRFERDESEADTI